MRRVTAIVILLFGCPPVWAQLQPGPPSGALWEQAENGDAVQKDLGFVLPKTWQDFERQGFTSTRPDGASVKVHYLSADKAISLGILLQLRADVRGMALPVDLIWKLMQASAEFEYAGRTKGKAVELSSEVFSLGKRTPTGRSRWARFDLDTGAEVQGVWWQNIGIWSVLITMSGPEARRADIEARANTLLAEMPFPSAPIATELAVIGAKLFADMPKCKPSGPDAKGVEVVPTFQEIAALSLIMPGLVLGRGNESLITPATRAKDYCLIETFQVRKDFPVTAIEYTGAATDTWEARYGFVLNNGKGGYYQVERMPKGAELSALAGDGSRNLVYLDFSNNKRASLSAVFDDWPSYEAAKKAVTALHASPTNRPEPVMTMTNPAGKVAVVTNPDRIQKLEE